MKKSKLEDAVMIVAGAIAFWLFLMTVVVLVVVIASGVLNLLTS